MEPQPSPRGALRSAAVLACLAWACLAFGTQAQQAMFRHYTVEHGMAQRQIEALTQDELGYLWVGTYHGVSRFDGHDFSHLPLDRILTVDDFPDPAAFKIDVTNGDVQMIKAERSAELPEMPMVDLIK